MARDSDSEDKKNLHNPVRMRDAGHMTDPDYERDPEVTGPVDEFHIYPSQGYTTNVEAMWQCMRCGYISEFADQPPPFCPDCEAPGETMEIVGEDRPDFP